MSSSDSFWLGILEWVGTIGFVAVIIGVAIEGVEHFGKFPRKDHARQKRIEKLGWFLVVAGLWSFSWTAPRSGFQTGNPAG